MSDWTFHQGLLIMKLREHFCEDAAESNTTQFYQIVYYRQFFKSDRRLRRFVKFCSHFRLYRSIRRVLMIVWLVGFLTSSSTTRLYRGRASRQSVWQFYVLPHIRQSWETMTSVSAGHSILTPTQTVGVLRTQSQVNRHQQIPGGE